MIIDLYAKILQYYLCLYVSRVFKCRFNGRLAEIDTSSLSSDTTLSEFQTFSCQVLIFTWENGFATILFEVRSRLYNLGLDIVSGVELLFYLLLACLQHLQTL